MQERTARRKLRRWFVIVALKAYEWNAAAFADSPLSVKWIRLEKNRSKRKFLSFRLFVIDRFDF